MRLLVIVMALLLVPSAAYAEWRSLSRPESHLLLRQPYLEKAIELFEGGDWETSTRVATSYAAAISPDRDYPRAQIYLNELAPLTFWKYGNTLDAQFIKRNFPFFADRELRVEAVRGLSDAWLRSAAFTADRAHCAIFELRHISNDPGGGMAADMRRSATGVYCPPVGMDLSEDLLRRVTEGIYVRQNGRIEPLVKRPGRKLPTDLTM